MKTLAWITLAALLVTGGILWSRRQARTILLIPAPNRATLTRTNALAARLRRAPAPAPERFRTPWDALNARDYAAFVELLREAGCPEDTVRAFAIAALGRDYQRRIEEPERARVRASVYWRDEWRGARSELPKEMLRQRTEMNATLARLLGASIREILQDFTSSNEPRDWLDDDRR